MCVLLCGHVTPRVAVESRHVAPCRDVIYLGACLRALSKVEGWRRQRQQQQQQVKFLRRPGSEHVTRTGLRYSHYEEWNKRTTTTWRSESRTSTAKCGSTPWVPPHAANAASASRHRAGSRGEGVTGRSATPVQRNATSGRRAVFDSESMRLIRTWRDRHRARRRGEPICSCDDFDKAAISETWTWM